ncbi:hypothetical protein N7492_007803 [Penicillium capsulatum]|uniref:Letm1 RBD domain-containing protein n=1 Tax=Penicillium capsulatum TaxID=69766 RepID=A0A9W9I2Y0_9EURO|nr:hypothetical protein N7492_007803 [Penicillium capsulatum]KAJ6117633.1 hypothetical protein N7512_007358 [Penicillium capsulatum]
MLSIARGRRALWSPLKSAGHSTAPLNLYTQLFSTSALRATGSVPSNRPPQQTTSPQPHDINAPTSTLPAEIDRPQPADPTASTPDKLKRVVAIGRAYLTFYKTGLKNVFRNYRASLPLRAQLGLPAYLPLSPPRQTSAASTAALSALQPAGLGRGQYQLVRRAARDVRRMIPFTLILMVCGEFTPLIIPVFGSAITPATCRVPRQITKDRDAHEKRKFAALRAHLHALRSTASAAELRLGGTLEHVLIELADPRWAESADVHAVLRACAVFDLVKSHDRFLGAALASVVYRPRLRRYLEYLAIDDGLIRAGGGVAAMSAAEVRIACDERGACGGGDGRVGSQDKASSTESRVRSSRPAPSSEEIQRLRNEKLERDWLARWLEVREKKTV